MKEEKYGIADIKDQYSRRTPDASDVLGNYSLLSRQEKEAVFVNLLRVVQENSGPLSELKVLVVGSGFGNNITDLIRWGFSPKYIVGCDILEERVDFSKSVLPKSVSLLVCDIVDLPADKFDLIYQSTVFSSILDSDYRKQCSEKLISLLSPGGTILWYDFAFSNPRNPDVTGIGLGEVNRLFSGMKILHKRRVTLAPPLARLVSGSAFSYKLLALCPLLRTHLFLQLGSKKRSDQDIS